LSPQDRTNAQRAVRLYEILRQSNRWTSEDAWKGIAILLLTCNKWESGKWLRFHGSVVYREVNDFKVTSSGRPNSTLRKAEQLSQFLATQLDVPRERVCGYLGQYWDLPEIVDLQPNNLVGHAFRSIVASVLKTYGNDEITYDEEVDPNAEFPGYNFVTRSKNPRIDIVARRGNTPIALISARWRYRHDRVDLVDEAVAYAQVRRTNPNLRFYAIVGEFAAARLEKVLAHCPPVHPSPPITATVHFCPDLVSLGLGENGRLSHLKSLTWLVDATKAW
jgi:hypothetical protein